MADTNRDINLRIRAQDYSKKTFQNLTKSIHGLVDAQKEQQDAASRGETSARALESSYKDLESATKAVVRQAADVKAFENQKKALNDARTATIDAQDALVNLEGKIRSQGAATKEQAAELKTLQREVKQAERNETRQADRYATLEQRLKSYGLSTNDTNTALNRLSRVVDAANQSLARQEKAVGDNELALKRLAEAEKQAAAADLAAATDRQRKALETLANDALAAASGWRTASVGARDLGQSINPVTASMQSLMGISAPTARSISQIGMDMRNMATQMNSSNGAISDLKGKMRDLGEAQKAVSSGANMIDTFNRQMQAVRAARQEYTEAQRNVRDLANQLKNSNGDTKSTEVQLRAAQVALANASKGFRDAADSAQLTRSQMRSLGIDTQNLAAAEQLLSTVATQVVNAQNAMGSAIQRNGSAQMNAQADAAVRLANSARQSAIGVRELAASTTPLADAIRGIISPIDTTNSSLLKMEQNAALMARAFTNISKPVSDAKQKFADLKNTQDALGKTATLIDTFNRQTKAVGDARQQYVQARQNLLNLSQQLRTSSGDNTQLEQRVRQASAAVQQAATSYRTEADAARQTQAALQGAGVATNQLSSETQRLSSAAHDAATAESGLRDAVARYGEEAKKANNANENTGRKALSMTQRLRSEVMALATAYVGVYGALNEVNNVVDAAKTKQKFFSQISIAVGQDLKDQALQWKFVNDLSEKWGVSLGDTAKQYSRFAVSATKAGGTIDDAKSLFESLTIVGRANNLNQEEMGRVFYAVDQMLSKGQVMTQELKQQLGEVIPGIFEQAGIILNKKTEGFQDKLSAGAYKVGAVYQIFGQMANENLEAAIKAADGIQAVEARLKSAKFNFDLKVADSGFLAKYAEFLQRVTDVIKSDVGDKFAKRMGDAFTSVTNAIIYLIENIDTVIGLLKGLAIIMGYKMVAGFIGGLVVLNGQLMALKLNLITGSAWLAGMTTSMGVLGVAATGLSVIMKGLGMAIPFIGWAIALGTLIYTLWQSSETFRHICYAAIGGIKAAFDYINNLVHFHYKSWQDCMKDANKWTDEMDKKSKNLPKSDRADGAIEYEKNKDGKYQAKDGSILGETPEERDKRLTGAASLGYNENDERLENAKKFNEQRNKELTRQEKTLQRRSVRELLKERLELIDDEYAPQIKEAQMAAEKDGGKAALEIQKTLNRARALEEKKFWQEQKEKAQQGAKGRAEAIKEIEDSIQSKGASLKVKDNKLNPTEDYQTREQASVDKMNHEYDKLEAKVRKLGGAEAEQFKARIDQLRQINEGIVRQQSKQDELSRLNDVMKSKESTRGALLEELAAQRDAHMISEVDYTNQVNAVYAQTQQGIQECIDKMREFGQANREAFSTDEEFQKWQAGINTMQTKLKTSGDQLNAYQKQGVEGLKGSISTGFNALSENIVAVSQETESWGDAFENVGMAMLQYFAQLLQQIAITIIQAAIMDALLGPAGGAAVGATNGAVKAGTNHNGGMAGSSGIGFQRVDASVFASAQRYHTGGMVGFQPDEVPIIAQQGEEVLTRDDPRNRLNGGLNGGNSSGPVRVIAVDDQRAAISEAMKTPEGQQAFITTLRSNLPAVKKMLGRSK